MKKRLCQSFFKIIFYISLDLLEGAIFFARLEVKALRGSLELTRWLVLPKLPILGDWSSQV